MIIGPQPLRGEILDFLDRIEQIVRQPVISDSPVVALDIGILLRAARLNEFQLDDALTCPCHGDGADVLRAIVAAYGLGRTAPLDDLFQGPDDAFCRKREIHVDAQAFPVKVVDHIEQPDRAPVG